MLKVKSITAKNCRGLIDGPLLEIAAGGMLLEGANGTGKSSYVDAIEKVVTGSCSSLDIGYQSVSWTKHGPHLSNKGPVEIILTLSDGGKDITVSLESDKTKLPSVARKWLGEGCKGSFLLRRRNMLQFVEAKPADRYDAIESFLNLREYVAWEEMLVGASEKLSTDLASTKERMRQYDAILRTRYSLPVGAPLTKASCAAAISGMVTLAGLSPVNSDEDIERSARDAAERLSAFGDTIQLQKIYGLLERCKEIPDGNELVLKATEYVEVAAAFERASATLNGHFYPAVLEKAVEWWEEDDLDSCPVCESTSDRAAVSLRVHDRLAEREAYILAEKQERTTRVEVLNELRRARRAAEEAEKSWRVAFELEPSAELAPVIATLAKGEHALANPVAGSTAHELAEMFASLELARAAESFVASAQSRSDGVPDVERHKHLSNVKLGCELYSSTFPMLAADERTASELEYRKAQLANVCELAQQARKDTVQALMDRVAAVADGYYQRIHPDESIGTPTLKVTDRGKASIQLESEFHGKRGDPRGRYSEAHVDSLGLCLFLAIRRLHHNQEKDFALLILDDVLHSVDGEHRRQTAELIFEEFHDHQVVVTTHDPIWFENLKAASGRVGKKFSKYNLAGWTLDEGPVLGDHLSDYEWLMSAQATIAKPADKVIKAGRLLEEVLHNACHNLKASIEYNIEGAYTMEPLWKAFRSRSADNKSFQLAAAEAIKRIDKIREIRNWLGAHWNAWALQLTPKEADDFVSAVVALRDVLYCSECDRFIQRIAQLDGVWSCPKEHKRYDAKIKSAS